MPRLRRDPLWPRGDAENGKLSQSRSENWPAVAFGQESELRRVEMESLHWLVELVRRAGVLRLVVNGSFVTDTHEPNDVDCVLLLAPGFPKDVEAEAELVNGLPFLDINLVRQEGWDELVGKVFATDRHRNSKGMIEVELWT